MTRFRLFPFPPFRVRLRPRNRALLRIAPLLLAAVLAGGCASSSPKDKPEENAVDPAKAFTPIRAKFSTVSPADLGDMESLRIAVIDADFTDGVASLGFVPGIYRPANGVCELLETRLNCASIAELVKAIDRHVDRMPFGILFTYRGRLASDADISRDLPPAYGDFYRGFLAAMKEEGIDFVPLVPSKVIFLR